jgi:C1A family cysteine protease
MSIPDEVDLRPGLPPVRDQGLLRGTCLAFAATTTHEARRRADDNDDEDLSTEALFWAAKEVEGNRDDGTTFSAVATALPSPGQPPESTWPYDPTRDITDAHYRPPAAANDSAVLRRARLQPVATTADAITAELAAGNVVVVGIELWEEFELLEDEGELDVPDAADRNGSYHAVALVGYSERSRRVLVRNSWAEDWGDGGYAWIPYDFVDNFVVAAAAIADLVASP